MMEIVLCPYNRPSIHIHIKWVFIFAKTDSKRSDTYFKSAS